MYWIIPGSILFALINILGLACFAYIVFKRVAPLLGANRDLRWDRPWLRLSKVGQFWLGQWKHPRYRFAGTIHILIFSGFLILATRAFSLLIFGASGNTATPGLIGRAYELIADYAGTIVFLCMVIAAVRRLVFKPARYQVPAKYGKGHPADAIFLLALIALLMASESLFEASGATLQAHQGATAEFLPALSLAWMFSAVLASLSMATIWHLHLGAYLIEVLTFYFLLCYRPFGIQFHVETSLFNVYFAKLDRATVKPVRWGVSDDQLDQVKSFGVKTFDDFTWKHMLDFYSCLRRLWALLGQLSGKRGGASAVATLPHHQGARLLRFQHYPSLWRNANNGHAADRHHLFQRMKSGRARPAVRAKRNVRCSSSTSTRSSTCGADWSMRATSPSRSRRR